MRHFCVCHWAPLRAHSAVGGRARGYLARKTPFKDLALTELSQPHPVLLSNTGLKALWEACRGFVFIGLGVGAGQASRYRPRACITTEPTLGESSGQRLEILNFWTKGPSHSFCTMPGKLHGQSWVSVWFVLRCWLCLAGCSSKSSIH